MIDSTHIAPKTQSQRSDLSETMELIRSSHELAMNTLKLLNEQYDVDKIGEILIGCGAGNY